MVVFIPGQDGDYPSVCLPQNSPLTTTTTTTKKPFHDHLHDVHWSLPGLFPPVDPFLNSFHSSLLYEPLLGWFRSDQGNVKKSVFNINISIYYNYKAGQLRNSSTSYRCSEHCKQKGDNRLKNNRRYKKKKVTGIHNKRKPAGGRRNPDIRYN